jgi:hypothetical protein
VKITDDQVRELNTHFATPQSALPPQGFHFAAASLLVDPDTGSDLFCLACGWRSPATMSR